MKRLSIITFLFVIISLSTYSQVDWGLRLGAARSSLTQKADGQFCSKGRIGFSFSGLADIHLKNRWSLRPEVAFTHQGGGYISNWKFSGVDLLNNKYKYYSIQVPINVVYNIPLSEVLLSLSAGPVLDFPLFGKMKTNSEEYKNINFWETDIEKDLKAFDLGVNIALSIEYSNFLFSINTVFGTLDRRSTKRDGESPVYQNNVTFSIGYIFRK